MLNYEIWRNALFDLNQFKKNKKATLKFWNFISKTNNPFNFINQHFLYSQNERVSLLKTKEEWINEGYDLNDLKPFHINVFYKLLNANQETIQKNIMVDLYDALQFNLNVNVSFDLGRFVFGQIRLLEIKVKKHTLDNLGCFLENNSETINLFMHEKMINNIYIKLYYVLEVYLSKNKIINETTNNKEALIEALTYLVFYRSNSSNITLNESLIDYYLTNFWKLHESMQNEKLYDFYNLVLITFYNLIEKLFNSLGVNKIEKNNEEI